VTDIRFACQTYSWQMTVDAYRGRLDHMISVSAKAGFAGFEPEVVMLGEDWTASGLRSQLADHGVQLAALCLVEEWSGPRETVAEATEADKVIETVAGIDGAVINLCQFPGADRAQLRARQDNLLSCVDAVSARAEAAGVHCTFHPNSPAGSVFRTDADYAYLLAQLPERIGFTPDLGHLAKGGMDPLEVVRRYRDRVDHVHVKDMHADGSWARTGEGIIDIPAVTRFLADTDFAGWIVLEDESPEAEADPDRAVIRNGAYVRNVLEAVIR
jgi:inosose dehydratase